MTLYNPIIVLQARFASKRLRGKVLAPLAGRPMLTRCLARLRLAGAGTVVLATTTRQDDDVLAALAISEGVPVVRGPESDVLHRFTLAARQMHATHVVRATADNPAIDIDAIPRVLDALTSSGADFVIEDGLPYGTCVEAMTAVALEKADALAVRADDREHVTLMMKRDRLFHSIALPAPAPLHAPHLSLTVDTLQDLAYMRAIMARLGNPQGEPSLRAIIDAAEALAPGAFTSAVAVGQ